MARQLLGRKKTVALRKQTGLDIIAVLVRGGTEHRRDLCLRDGTVKFMWPDGEITIPEPNLDGSPYHHACHSVLDEK
jgi:hypothetical protein